MRRDKNVHLRDQLFDLAYNRQGCADYMRSALAERFGAAGIDAARSLDVAPRESHRAPTASTPICEPPHPSTLTPTTIPLYEVLLHAKLKEKEKLVKDNGRQGQEQLKVYTGHVRAAVRLRQDLGDRKGGERGSRVLARRRVGRPVRAHRQVADVA